MVELDWEQACRKMFDEIMTGNTHLVRQIDNSYSYVILANHLREAALELRTLTLELSRPPLQNKN